MHTIGMKRKKNVLVKKAPKEENNMINRIEEAYTKKLVEEFLK